jgi:iron transport multicopper oxidase
MPDGILINGRGPYLYNATLVADGIEHTTINVEPGNLFFNLRFECVNVFLIAS